MSDISGSRTLHRLIYSSRDRIAHADLDHEVGLIVAASIRNNRAIAVTGLLLVHEGWFLQALEGPAEAVMNTYRRILDDHRHEFPKVLGVGPVANREFGDWNMCAHRMSDVDDAILDTLSMRGGFVPESFTAMAALRLLTSVRDIQAGPPIAATA